MSTTIWSLNSQSALVTFINSTLEALDQSQCVTRVFCNLITGFWQCKSHNISQKLHSLGVHGTALIKQRNIIKSETVKICSVWSDILSGYLKGPYLDLFLFIYIYIYKSMTCLEFLQIQIFLLFCDNTTAFTKSKTTTI